MKAELVFIYKGASRGYRELIRKNTVTRIKELEAVGELRPMQRGELNILKERIEALDEVEKLCKE